MELVKVLCELGGLTTSTTPIDSLDDALAGNCDAADRAKSLATPTHCSILIEETDVLGQLVCPQPTRSHSANSVALIRILEDSYDDPILRGVKDRLAASGYPELRLIECEYYQGELLLSGCVSTHYLKQLAQESLRAQLGVKTIVNRLVVKAPT